MALAENLKEARNNKKITQEELASMLGKSKNVISNWERGDNKPDADTLFVLCDIFGVDANYLLGWSENNNVSLSIKEQKHIKKYRSLDENDKKAVDGLINTLSERRTEHAKEFINLYPPKVVSDYGYLASAGNGQFVFDDIPFEMVEVPYECKADFVIGVNGDSMEPTYHDREKLLVKKQPSINKGEIGIFMVDGKSYVKELGNNELISHNKKHNNIPFNENMLCVGKVLGKL